MSPSLSLEIVVHVSFGRAGEITDDLFQIIINLVYRLAEIEVVRKSIASPLLFPLNSRVCI